MKMKTVHAECDACGGTGLYNGFMEARDQAVVCVVCHGTGRDTIKYKPFSHRRKRKGIKSIRFGSGLILDNPSSTGWFSYKEFEKQIPPPSRAPRWNRGKKS